jgi:hypothetical protein
MAEIRINTTGGLKLYDADNSHYAQIVAGTITSNVDAITLGHDTVTIVDNLSLGSDSAVLKFGADGDTTLTHTDGTGLTLNSTNKICFNDASQFIQGSSATVLSIGATDEIDLTATAVDLNGTLNVSGVATFQANPVFPDGGVAVADLDIDGATDIGAAIVDADLFIVDDGAGGTNRKTTASRIKTYIGSGLSETETWRVSTGANVSSGSAFFTSNWEQDDTYGAVDVGTGMTESSGVFSFPSTGIYEINFTVGFINDNGGNQAKYLVSEIHLTTDNSSYNKAAEAANSNAPEASSIYSFATTSCLFDVTNTSNDKVKFQYNVQQDFAYIGNTNYNATFATFKRLGDT